MGMTRKIMSVLTFGLIDDRSDEERDRDRARAAESVRPPLRN